MQNSTSSLPSWPGFCKPVLEVLLDGAVWPSRALKAAVLDHAGITEEQRAERLGSGESRALNRVDWAMSFLYRAKAVEKPGRGQFRITDVGRTLLAENPDGISEATLKRIPAFLEYVPTRGKAASVGAAGAADGRSVDEVDPLELIEEGIVELEADVAAELLSRLREGTPDFFEQTVVDLLVAMGYGGTESRVTRLGRSGDGGVDGVIDEDALGLSQVYVQAKRYAAGNAVQRPELQAFVGALADKNTTRGVFVTTSTFTTGAREYVEKVPHRIVLVDGSRLAELMIRYRVGVQVKRSYDLVEVDEDYFQ